MPINDKHDLNNYSISLHDKIQILTKAYSIITKNFSNWDPIIDLDFDNIFDKFISKSIESESRKDFMFLMKELIAILNNGHSGYKDNVISQLTGYLDFQVDFYDQKWLISKSYNQMLPIGTEITHINDIPMSDFYDANKKYISASSEYERKSKFGSPFHEIFENEFIITIENGKKIHFKKVPTNLFMNYDQMEVEGKWISQGQIGYIKIPSFNKSKFETKALEYVQEYFNARSIIIDLRDNGGGNTPIGLIESLMNVPYRWWSEATAMSFGLFNFYASQSRLNKKTQSEVSDNFVAGMENVFETIDNGSLLMTSTFELPKDSCYKGRLIVLINRNTGSSAEDFCMPLKIFRKATLIGERTRGSTGQPYYIKFPMDIEMYVSTKRTFFPNGDVFEGRGIEPTYTINLAQKEFQLDKDIILEKAILIANENKKSNNEI